MKMQPTMKSKMRQLDLFVDQRSLFEKLCDEANLYAGFAAVKKNGGSPGIDGVTIEEFKSRVDEELAQLKKDLESWRYKPNPVRRVEIPYWVSRTALQFFRYMPSLLPRKIT